MSTDGLQPWEPAELVAKLVNGARVRIRINGECLATTLSQDLAQKANGQIGIIIKHDFATGGEYSSAAHHYLVQLEAHPEEVLLSCAAELEPIGEWMAAIIPL